MNDNINAGLAARIVDPDGGANVAAKAERLRAEGVQNATFLPSDSTVSCKWMG